MDQWKLLLQALLLTLFVPLLLWTGLFVVFGWKLFLFLAVGVALLLMYGDKLIQLPMFKSLMRMLVPFGTTYSFYKALQAGKDVKDKQGSSWKALWASMREFLANSSKASEEEAPEDKKPAPKRALPETTETAKSRSFWFGGSSKPTEDNTSSSASTEKVPVDKKKERSMRHQTEVPKEPEAPRSRKRASDEEIEESLAALKAKMARDNKRKSK